MILYVACIQIAYCYRSDGSDTSCSNMDCLLRNTLCDDENMVAGYASFEVRGNVFINTGMRLWLQHVSDMKLP